MDIEYIPKDVGKRWLAEATENSAMLSGLIKTKRGFLKKAYLSYSPLALNPLSWTLNYESTIP